MKRIICHGDSLTEGADIEPAYRWPALLQNALGGVEVTNAGIGGDTTAGMLSRFSHDVVGRKPDLVILLGGTNDFWWDLPVNLVVSNLYAMAYQARYHGIAPIFGLPLPFDADIAASQSWSPPEKGYATLMKRIESLTQRLTLEAGESEIPVLDFYRLFLNEDRTARSSLFLEDGVHPNREGHREMAVLAAAALKKLFLIG